MIPEEYNKLRWQCRRGMLELDILLLPFFEQKFSTLSVQEQQQFAALLECEDQDLYVWLMQSQPPVDQALTPLISKILGHE